MKDRTQRAICIALVLGAIPSTCPLLGQTIPVSRTAIVAASLRAIGSKRHVPPSARTGSQYRELKSQAGSPLH